MFRWVSCYPQQFFYQTLPTGALFKFQLLLILLAFTTDLNCIYEHFYSIHAKGFSLRRKVVFSVESSSFDSGTYLLYIKCGLSSEFGQTWCLGTALQTFFLWEGETLYLMVFLVSGGNGFFPIAYFPSKLNTGSLSCV